MQSQSAMEARDVANVMMDVAEVGATLATIVFAPGVIPLISPLFRICRGTGDLIAGFSSEPDRTTEMLNGIAKGIDTLKRSSEVLAQGVGLLAIGATDMGQVQYFLRRYGESHRFRHSRHPRHAHHRKAIEAITCDSHGLEPKLNALQGLMDGSTRDAVNPGQSSWITHVCQYCQKDENLSKNDKTWGLKAASKQFSAVLALQRTAIAVLRELGRDVQVYIKRTDEQVNLFRAKFEEVWRSHIGRMRLACEKFPRLDSSCYGHLSGNKFYRFVRAEGRRSSAIQSIDLSTGIKTFFSMGQIKNHRKKCRIFVHDNEIYTVDSSSGELYRINLNTHEVDIMCDGMKFNWRSKMVCHEGYLYVVNTNNKLCKIDLDSEEQFEEVSRFSWSTSKFGSTALTAISGNPLVYAITGSANELVHHVNRDTISSINPSNGHKEDLLHCRYFTNMALVGHGRHLYAIDSQAIWSYSLNDGNYEKITHHRDYKSTLHCRSGTRSVHLMSEGLSLYMQFNSRRSVKVYLVQPHLPPWEDIFT